jgi:hypothetical protein
MCVDFDPEVPPVRGQQRHVEVSRVEQLLVRRGAESSIEPE